MRDNISYKTLLLDISGVLYEGTRPVEGADQLISRAREKGILLRFVTNTASKDRQMIIADLHAMGMGIQAEELFTAPMAAKRYIQTHHWRPFCLIHEAIRPEFADLNQHDPTCVLLGDARNDLHYQSLNRAFQLCKQGLPLIGIGMNKYFREGDEFKLDAGPFIRAIEWAADTTAIIMGKPSRKFFEAVIASTACNPHDCLMVGDDVFADVQGAIDAGLQACLVRTGKFQAGDEKQVPPGGLIFDSVADLIAYLPD